MSTSTETRSRFTQLANYLAPSRQTSDKWNENTGAAICLNLAIFVLSIPTFAFSLYCAVTYKQVEERLFDLPDVEYNFLFSLISAALAAFFLSILEIILYSRFTLHPTQSIVTSVILTGGCCTCLVFAMISPWSSESAEFYDAWDEWAAYLVGALYAVLIIIYLTYLGFAAAALHKYNKRNFASVRGNTKPVTLKVVAPGVDNV